MQFRQLEIFLAVAQHSSFSKAADTLMLSQPTISSHIRALETELRAQLFIRSTKGLRLTQQGEILYTYASQIIHFVDRARSELSEIEESQRNRLTIAASTVPAQYLLPCILPKVKQLYPKICFHILQSDSSAVLQAITNSEVDIGIVGYREEKDNLLYYPLIEENLVIATPNTPYFRSMNGVMDPTVLKNFPFIMREKGSGTRKIMEDYLQGQNIQPEEMNIVAEMPSTECTLRSISNGLGISIVSELATELCAGSLDLLCFNLNSPLSRRQFYLVTREDIPPTEIAHCMIDVIQKFGQNHSAPSVKGKHK